LRWLHRSEPGCCPTRVPTSPFCTVSPVYSADCQGVALTSRHRSWCRRIRGLVASRCRSWGSVRFCRRYRVVAGPVPVVIADVAHRRTPRSWLPRTVCSYPPEDSPDPQPHSVTTAVALPDFGAHSVVGRPGAAVASFTDLAAFEGMPVPQGVAPRGGPYWRAPLKVRDSLPSLGLVPLRGCLRCHVRVPSRP
jgi:hypothetical protein